MKKATTLWIILKLVFLVIFNAFFFALGGVEHNVSVWISYGCIHFAYSMLMLTPLLTRKGKSSALFGFSLMSTTIVYFLIVLVIGIIFIMVSPESYTAALLVQLLLAGLYGIILIPNMIANEYTAEAEEKRQHQIQYVKDASAKIKCLIDKENDKGTKKKIEKVYDAIYSSPVKSHPNLAQMENRIIHSINELDNAISIGNKESIASLIDSLLSAVNERNIQLKTLK